MTPRPASGHLKGGAALLSKRCPLTRSNCSFMVTLCDRRQGLRALAQYSSDVRQPCFTRPWSAANWAVCHFSAARAGLAIEAAPRRRASRTSPSTLEVPTVNGAQAGNPLVELVATPLGDPCRHCLLKPVDFCAYLTATGGGCRHGARVRWHLNRPTTNQPAAHAAVELCVSPRASSDRC